MNNIINYIQNFNTTIKILNKVFNYYNNEIIVYEKNINKLSNQLLLTFDGGEIIQNSGEFNFLKNLPIKF